MKAQTIDRGHGGLFGRLTYKAGYHTERIGMIGIQVLDGAGVVLGLEVRSPRRTI